MTALYNEVDPYAAQWLRNLINQGVIAPGIVDESDIRDLTPDYVSQFTQFHTFAGIGVWSGALRAAGWPDDRPVWTGSAPCQPWSAAGAGGGFADERHLWPHWFYLIRECRPPRIFGEQVASKDGLAWNDTVSLDLEAEGYAFGPLDICAAGITVEWEESQAGQWLRRAIRDCTDPSIAAMLRDFAEFARGNIGEGGHHIRQRQYFVAERVQGLYHHHQGLEGLRLGHCATGGRDAAVRSVAEAGESDRMADMRCGRVQSEQQCRDNTTSSRKAESETQQWQRCGTGDCDCCATDRLSQSNSGQCNGIANGQECIGDGTQGGRQQGDSVTQSSGTTDRLSDVPHVGYERAGSPWIGGTRPSNDSADVGLLHASGNGRIERGTEPSRRSLAGGRSDVGLCNTAGSGPLSGAHAGIHSGEEGSGSRDGEPERSGATSLGMGLSDDNRRTSRGAACEGVGLGNPADATGGCADSDAPDSLRNPVDWLLCRDGKWRATRPGTLPLAHDVTSRVGKLRAYGNALDFQTAKRFIEIYLEHEADVPLDRSIPVTPNDLEALLS